MREKTNGIVFSLVPYNDKVSFVRIYTEQFGPVTYSVPCSQSRRSRVNRQLFSAFTLLELEVEHFPDRDIQKIRETRLLEPHLGILSDPVKSAITLFLAEFLSRTIREQEPNPGLYRFITDAVSFFNLVESGKANFHLVFLSRISAFLGFSINRQTFVRGFRLDMLDGVFTGSQPEHSWFLSAEDSYLLNAVLNMNFSDMDKYHLNRLQRASILDNMMTYFRLHIPDLKEIRSLDVLKSIFE